MKATTLAEEIGLAWNPAFFRDKLVYLSLLSAPLGMAIASWLFPAWSAGAEVSIALAVSVVLWQPLVEELLFRGVIQGRLRELPWGHCEVAGLTVANVLTTVTFVLAHMVNHGFWWAMAVSLPSLVFGYFRDRHNQIYPAVLMHAAYNGFYFFGSTTLGNFPV